MEWNGMEDQAMEDHRKRVPTFNKDALGALWCDLCHSHPLFAAPSYWVTVSRAPIPKSRLSPVYTT